MTIAIDTQLILPIAEAEAEVALASNRPTQALEAATRGIARAERVVGGNFKRYGPVYGLGIRCGR